MNTCEELIKRIEVLTTSKPVVTNNLQPVMVPAEDGEWIKKSEVLEAVNA